MRWLGAPVRHHSPALIAPITQHYLAARFGPPDSSALAALSAAVARFRRL